MKILIVLGGFFPAQTYGGPTVSIDNLCTLLCDSVDFYIVTSDHELNAPDRLGGITEGWNQRCNCKVLYVRSDEDNAKRYVEIVNEVSPDIIYINSLFSAHKTIPFLRIAYKKQISLLLAPRGELCVNAFDKKYKKIPYLLLLRKYLRGNNVWYQSTSEEEDVQIAKIIGVQPQRIFRLTNVATVPQTGSMSQEKSIGSCNLVFISRIQDKKNLLYALKCLSSVKTEVSYDIYGPLESQEYWNRCQDEIEKLPSNIKVEYRGQLKHNEVLDTFKKYHAFFFPTLSENYGHVLVESMLAGCPVITSDQVPWTDVNDSNAGWSISLNQRSEFISAIENLSNMSADEFNTLRSSCIQYISQKVDFVTTKRKYIDCFSKIAEKNV